MSIHAVIVTDNLHQVRIKLSEDVGVCGAFSQASRADVESPVLRRVLGIEGLLAVTASPGEWLLTRDPNLDWDTILDAIKLAIV